MFYCKLSNFIPSPTCSHAITGNSTGISLTIIKRRPCHSLTQTPLKLSLFLHFYYIFPIFFVYCIYTTFPHFSLYCIYTTFSHFFHILHLHYISPFFPYTAFTLLFHASSLYYFPYSTFPHIFPILLFFYLSHYVLISTPVRNVNIRQFLYLFLVSGTAFIVYSHSV